MTYLEWLSELLIPDDNIRESYQKLMLGLYHTEFLYFVKNDQNRACDGEKLRIIYKDETGLESNNYNSCSVLEMLGALSIRCYNEIMYDPDSEDKSHEWFWEMITNLGLSGMDDWHFDEDRFDHIMEKLNNRTYDKDGFGGPFYIAGYSKDMRKIELWYQLNQYILSKYEW